MPRLLSSLLIAAILATTIPLSIASTSESFPDVDENHPFAESIENIREAKIVDGYPDKNFRPNNNVKRAEFAKIVIGAAFAESELEAKDCFPDVKEEDWFSPFVCKAKEEGIASGYSDGYFRPGNPINFAEASKMVSQALKLSIPENQETTDWFEGFAKALADKKAIPVTVDNFGDKITRGELAEMIGRLIKNETEKPSLNYTTLQASSGKLKELPKISSCSELSTRMRLASTSTPTLYRGIMLEETEATFDSVNTNSAAKSSELSGSGSDDYSQTNVQVEGVDEADIVKNDGEYLYVINNDASIRIVKAYPASSMKEVAKISFSEFRPNELYIYGDYLVAIGTNWRVFEPGIFESKMIAPYYPHSSNWTKAIIFDISERSNPEEVRTVEFEGSYQTSRLIDDDLYLVINQYPNYHIWLENYDENSLLPQFRDSEQESKDEPVVGCSEISYFPGMIQPHYLIVAGIDIDSKSKDISREVYLGHGTNVYASTKNLYVATTAHEPYETISQYDYYVPPIEKTNIYKFGLDDGEVDYKGQGSVPGTVLNQFSMDEYDNHFRIATTENPGWWGWGGRENDPSKNNVFVLDEDLEKVGEIRDIAPGEKIYSARFLGRKAYMVTFRQIDPFFVIDLSRHSNPKILGQLKIPGYSDYLHPYDEDHIIGFGKDTVADDKSDLAWQQGFKMAIFDVTDVSNPKELFKETIGDRGTDSELLRNHKALLFSKAKNLLAFPITIAKIPESRSDCESYTYSNCPSGCERRYTSRSTCEEDICYDNEPDSEKACVAQTITSSTYGEPVWQGAMIYSLNLVDGFKEKGRITHYDDEELLKTGYYFYGDQSISRALYIGDTLYTLSNALLKANDLDDLDEIESLEF